MTVRMVAAPAATVRNGSDLRPQIVTIAPAPASARAMAAPMPVPPPVTKACRPARVLIGRSSSDHRRARLGAFGEAMQLITAGVVGGRPGFSAVAEPRRDA